MSPVPRAFVAAALASSGVNGCIKVDDTGSKVDETGSPVDDTGLPAEECDIRETAVELAGSGAIDCGEANGKDAASVWKCAVDAFEGHHAFYLLYDDHCADCSITAAWVSDSARIWVLSQEIWGEDGGPLGIAGRECVEPSVGTRDSNEYYPKDPYGYPALECGSYEPEGNHYQVCGPICESCSPQPLPFDP